MAVMGPKRGAANKGTLNKKIERENQIAETERIIAELCLFKEEAEAFLLRLDDQIHIWKLRYERIVIALHEPHDFTKISTQEYIQMTLDAREAQDNFIHLNAEKDKYAKDWKGKWSFYGTELDRLRRSLEDKVLYTKKELEIKNAELLDRIKHFKEQQEDFKQQGKYFKQLEKQLAEVSQELTSYKQYIK